MLQRIVHRVQAHLAEAVASMRPGDRFVDVWTDADRVRQRALVRRVAELVTRTDLRLFLFWGSLLGQVREGRILPWDDDVDFALFDVDASAVERLMAALEDEGLQTRIHNPGERIIKIFDPAYPNVSGQPWTWPFVDLFVYGAPGRDSAPFEPSPVPLDLVEPGRPVRFETADLWLVREPLRVLDRLYADWRTTERSPSWNHRTEQPIRGGRSRRIDTHSSGRKCEPS